MSGSVNFFKNVYDPDFGRPRRTGHTVRYNPTSTSMKKARAQRKLENKKKLRALGKPWKKRDAQ